MKFALDTNVVVRLLVADEPAQVARARERVEEALREGRELLVPVLVVQEVVWVLCRSYKVPKGDVLLALSGLLETPPFLVQDAELVREAMSRWRDGAGDFSDYLIRATAGDCDVVLTFDMGIQGEHGFGGP